MSLQAGKCSNAEAGTFGHECGKPAQWIGTRPSTATKSGQFHAAFCDGCRKGGHDAGGVTEWRPFAPGFFNDWN